MTTHTSSPVLPDCPTCGGIGRSCPDAEHEQILPDVETRHFEATPNGREFDVASTRIGAASFSLYQPADANPHTQFSIHGAIIHTARIETPDDGLPPYVTVNVRDRDGIGHTITIHGVTAVDLVGAFL